MKKVFIIVISTIVLILIICGIEFFTNNRHQEEQNAADANENAVINENTLNYSSNNISEPIDTSNRTIDNVEMKIKEGTLTRISAIIEIVDKNEEPYDYGQGFRIEKNENGEWKELEIKNGQFAFEDIAYIPDEDGIIEMNTSWENLYGELEAGEYRLVKEVYDNGKKYIYAEFVIE